MLKHRKVLVSLACLLNSLCLHASELLETDTSWDGQSFHYPQGTAQVTSLILRLEEGETTPWHCHPIPTMGYVLNGSIEVETGEGKSTRLEAGESVVEVMRTFHRGRGGKDGVAIVVFYAGAAGVPNTVLKEEGDSTGYCLP